MPAKLSPETWLRRFRETHGYKYRYRGVDYSQSKARGPEVLYECPTHGLATQDAYLHSTGAGCLKCALDARKNSGPARRSPESWLEQFKAVHGDRYTYIGVEYKDGKSQVTYVCGTHGKHTQTTYAHRKGSGCPKCALESRARRTIDEWAAHFETIHGKKYTYKSVDYTGKRALITYVCEVHGDVTQSTGNHLRNGCNACGVAARAASRKFELSDLVPRFVEAHGDKYAYVGLVSEGRRQYVYYTCEKHGENLQIIDSHARGHGCSGCTPSGGMGNEHTKEIAEFVSSLGLSTIEEHNFGLSRKRWDVVVPDAKLAIEFDGVYFHSEKFKKNKDAMLEKAEEAATQGFRQINVFEDEWYEKKDIVKRLIASAAGKSLGPTVYARKTFVIELSAQEAREFLDANHIQGFTSGSNYIGLKSSSSIVACMVYSYKGAGRATARVEDCVDLQRYATNCKVVGGFQKLLKHMLLDQKIRTVVSYSDPRLFSGNTYKVAGFTSSPEGPADYCYIKGSKRISKRARQKSWFRDTKDALYDESLTEAELAQLNGYHRLWFRGKVKWTLQVKGC